MRYIALGIFLSVLVAAPARADGAGAADTLWIAFTANTNGQLLDCGCPGDAAGGLPRRATVIKRLRKAHPGLILLDGGDCLGTVPRQLQNATVLEAYKMLPYSAVALGEQEFWNGLAFFQREVLGAGLPLLCTNLRLKTALSSPAIAREKRWKEGNFRVRLFALLDPGSFDYFDEGDKPPVELTNPGETLRRRLRQKKRGELILVIYHGTGGGLSRLARRIAGVDVWFLAHQEGKLAESWTDVAPPRVIPSSTDGESVELVRIVRGRDGLRISARRIWLVKSVPPDPGMQKLAEDYFDDLRVNLTGSRDARGVYHGTASCRHCHLLAFQAWRESAHSASLAATEGKGKKCQKCHTSRRGKGAVGCEDCHRISPRHGEWDFRDTAALESARKCKTCHTKKWSPNFRFEVYWKKIAHVR